MITVANHVWETNGHSMDFVNSIVFNSHSTLRRHLVESALINLHSTKSLNGNLGFNPTNKLLSQFIGSLVNIT